MSGRVLVGARGDGRGGVGRAGCWGRAGRGARTEESTNYLTGVKLTRKYRYDRRRDDEVLVSEKRARAAGRRMFLEDVGYNNP